MDTLRNDSMIKLALDTIDLVILRWQVGEARSNKPVDLQQYPPSAHGAPATCWPSAQHDGGATLNRSTRPSRITDDMFARIPALLLEGTTKAEIAAMYGVTLSTLPVLQASRRGISLRKGGPRRTKLTLPDEPLPLSDGVLTSLREAAQAMGRDSAARLASDLLEKIAIDGLYEAVLDEAA